MPHRTQEKSSASRPPKPRQNRMDPEEREALIVEEAILFFAEHGFEGRTRDLAKRIGITQPLLYRYFPSKEHLIERVYQEVYVRRWRPEWEALISDRAIPLKERLRRFYKEYSRSVYDYVWVRMFVYSGLRGVDINHRYLAVVRDKILKRICVELRRDQGLPGPEAVPVTDAEIELAWGLHGMFFYRAIRHFVYGLPMVEDPDAAIDNDVRTFLAGAPDAQRRIVDSAQSG